MKKLLTTAVLVLATSQVAADGFYQQVITRAPQAASHAANPDTEFSYTPLYRQVSAAAARLAAGERHGPNPEFSYTPLYLKVVGPAEPWGRNGRIAQK